MPPRPPGGASATEQIGPQPQLIQVAVVAPLARVFTYAVAPGTALPAPGTRLTVPLGRQKVLAIALGPHEGPTPSGLRRVLEVLDDGEPAIPADVLATARFAASYYRAPLGEVLRATLPPGLGQRPGPRLRLSAPGRRLLDVSVLSGLSDAEVGVLKQLQRGPRSRRGLLRAGVAATLLGRLLEQELVELAPEAGVAQPRARARYALAMDPDQVDLPASALRMRQLVELLAARGEVDAAELELEAPGARAVLQRLHRRGVVQRREEPAPMAPPQGVPEENSGRVELTTAQQHAVDAVIASLAPMRYTPFLLHGITSSGKTEVYLTAAQRALELGRGVLLLVPEIALTPQLVGRVQQRLGIDVEVLHSGLPQSERRRRWQRVRDGVARCVIGARSAIFAPVARLGLIVVDEEHEPTYKQDETPRYNARDLALVRGRELSCPVVLGSATPSLESYQRAQDGHYQLLSLPQRVLGATLPAVEIVGIERPGAGLQSSDAELDVIGDALHGALEQTLARGEQAILFLNRRGFASFVICLDCGLSVGCPNCSVTLTLHKARQRLICHYCGHQQSPPHSCERCSGARVVPFGVGTERLQEEVARRFPQARLARLDRDATRKRGELLRVLTRFARREADVLVGTQMLAKGHDYPGVTLVGVVFADVSLAVADFRAAERTFQLLAQVAGRAGRGSRPGRVIIQALDVMHPAIVAARSHDYVGFAEQELPDRQALGYPPFGRVALARIEGRVEEQVERAAAAMVRQASREITSNVALLGPAPAPLARLRGVSRFQILIKGQRSSEIQAALSALERAHAAGASPATRLVFDVDPTLVL